MEGNERRWAVAGMASANLELGHDSPQAFLMIRRVFEKKQCLKAKIWRAAVAPGFCPVFRFGLVDSSLLFV
jgi:hypothetical protein